MLPLFFQAILQDSATKAGIRLSLPSLAMPLGGLISGTVMSRWGKLIPLMRTGLILMTVGQAMVSSWAFSDASWKYVWYIFPSHLGTGMVYPAILFISIASHAHSGMYPHMLLNSQNSLLLTFHLQTTPCLLRPPISFDPSEPSGAYPSRRPLFKTRSASAYHRS